MPPKENKDGSNEATQEIQEKKVDQVDEEELAEEDLKNLEPFREHFYHEVLKKAQDDAKAKKIIESSYRSTKSFDAFTLKLFSLDWFLGEYEGLMASAKEVYKEVERKKKEKLLYFDTNCGPPPYIYYPAYITPKGPIYKHLTPNADQNIDPFIESTLPKLLKKKKKRAKKMVYFYPPPILPNAQPADTANQQQHEDISVPMPAQEQQEQVSNKTLNTIPVPVQTQPQVEQPKQPIQNQQILTQSQVEQPKQPKQPSPNQQDFTLPQQPTQEESQNVLKLTEKSKEEIKIVTTKKPVSEFEKDIQFRNRLNQLVPLNSDVMINSISKHEKKATDSFYRGLYMSVTDYVRSLLDGLEATCDMENNSLHDFRNYRKIGTNDKGIEEIEEIEEREEIEEIKTILMSEDDECELLKGSQFLVKFSSIQEDQERLEQMDERTQRELEVDTIKWDENGQKVRKRVKRISGGGKKSGEQVKGKKDNDEEQEEQEIILEEDTYIRKGKIKRYSKKYRRRNFLDEENNEGEEDEEEEKDPIKFIFTAKTYKTRENEKFLKRIHQANQSLTNLTSRTYKPLNTLSVREPRIEKEAQQKNKKRITMKHMIHYLETNPRYRRSPWLYKAYLT